MTYDNMQGPQGSTPPLQFDRAESATGGPAGAVCAACKQPIARSYFTAGQALICPACREALVAHQEGGSRLARFFGALGLGLAAGIVGGLIWYIVRRTTGYEVGLVAIFVGLMVGGAVRRGARARGGWVYQTMAILLTYSCIVAQYMPDVLKALHERFEADRRIAATQPATTTRPAATAAMPGDAGSADQPNERPTGPEAGWPALALHADPVRHRLHHAGNGRLPEHHRHAHHRLCAL